MWKILRPKNQEKNKTQYPVWNIRDCGLSGSRKTAGHEVNLLRSRRSHTLVDFFVVVVFIMSICVFICVWVCAYWVCALVQVPEARGIRQPGAKVCRRLGATKSGCQKLNLGLLQEEHTLLNQWAICLFSPCEVPDSERRRKEMDGVLVHESDGFQPYSDLALILLPTVRALGRT